MQHQVYSHFALPFLLEGRIFWDHLCSDAVDSTDKADQRRQLYAMSRSREASTTCRRSRADVRMWFAKGSPNATGCVLEPNEPSVRATWKGLRTPETAFGLPKPRLIRRITDPCGSRRDRPPAKRVYRRDRSRWGARAETKKGSVPPRPIARGGPPKTHRDGPVGVVGIPNATHRVGESG